MATLELAVIILFHELEADEDGAFWTRLEKVTGYFHAREWGVSRLNILKHLDASARKHCTPASKGKVAWREWGKGAPLILIHGGFGSWRHWVRNIPALSSEYRILAPDLPGMGDSDPVPEAATPSEILTALIDGLKSILGHDCRYHLAGFSFGGMIAGMLASEEQGQILSLSLIAPICLAVGRPRPKAVSFRRLAGKERRSAHHANLMSMMLSDPSYADDLALEIQEQNNLNVRANSFELTLQPFLRMALPRITATPHFIWGERDNFGAAYMDENISIVQAARPDAIIELVPKAGHWLAYENPDQVNAFIRKAACC